MLDRIWDFFVDTMMTLFMPLVCSYFTLSTDLFLNLSTRDASGLEWVGNTLLAPTQYLFAGREAIKNLDGSWEFAQRFNYKDAFLFKAAASIAALPASLVLGSAVKGLSFLNAATRLRFASLKAAWQSKTVYSHAQIYQKMGLEIGNPSQAEWFMPEIYQRRPGDERQLNTEKKALKDISALLNEAKIPWWVDCGTCLGAYRYGGVIPWDEDIDIAVLLIDFENVRRLLNRLDQKQYLVQDWSTRDHPNSFIKVFIRESGTMIDIYHFAVIPETRELQFIFSLETHLFFPEWFKIRERRFKAPVSFDAVFPLKKALLDGIEVFIPREPKKYLQRCYGENLAPVKVYDPQTGRYEKDLTHPYWLQAYVH